MQEEWTLPFEIRDIRNGEWYWVQKEVLASKDLNASDKLVYSALAYYANNKTQECFPSYTQICNLINISRPTAIKSIDALIKYGFISKRKNDGKVNYYELIDLRNVTSKNSLPVQNQEQLVKNSTTNNTNTNTSKTNIVNPILTPIPKKEINKERKFSSLKDITPEVIREIADKYQVTTGFVYLQFEKMQNWMKAKGRTYKDHKHALSNWVLGDMQKQIERRQDGQSKAVDARNIR